jgi:hypothetical protein
MEQDFTHLSSAHLIAAALDANDFIAGIENGGAR